MTKTHSLLSFSFLLLILNQAIAQADESKKERYKRYFKEAYQEYQIALTEQPINLSNVLDTAEDAYDAYDAAYDGASNTKAILAQNYAQALAYSQKKKQAYKLWLEATEIYKTVLAEQPLKLFSAINELLNEANATYNIKTAVTLKKELTTLLASNPELLSPKTISFFYAQAESDYHAQHFQRLFKYLPPLISYFEEHHKTLIDKYIQLLEWGANVAQSLEADVQAETYNLALIEQLNSLNALNSKQSIVLRGAHKGLMYIHKRQENIDQQQHHKNTFKALGGVLVVRKVAPKYPKKAILSGREAQVSLEFTVNKNGKVIEAKVNYVNLRKIDFTKIKHRNKCPFFKDRQLKVIPDNNLRKLFSDSAIEAVLEWEYEENEIPLYTDTVSLNYSLGCG